MGGATNGTAAQGAMDMDDVRDRFAQIAADLGATFREREGAIQAMILGALAGSNVLLVGPPGTAKSALFNGFLASFTKVRSFDRLLTKFTTEDAVFGPVKLSALKQDRLERSLTGRLADVEAAFVDEVFKGSDAVLNTLLQAMNERTYEGARIPLRMLVGASNELPQDEILDAMFDRFLVRDVVQYIEADSVWMDLVAEPPTFTPGVTVSLEEWDAARAAVSKVGLPRRVVAEMLSIKKALAAAGIIVSDRRWIGVTRILRAAAWLDGCPAVELDHLATLRFCLWTKPDERSQIQTILDQIDAGPVRVATDKLDAALRAWRTAPVDAAARKAALPTISGQITDTILEVEAILSGGVTRSAAARLTRSLEELRAAHGEVVAAMRARFARPANGAAARA